MCDIHSLAILLLFHSTPRVEYPRAPREAIVVSPRTVALLTTYLGSEDPNERSEALGMLRQARDPHTAHAVYKLTDDAEPVVRAQALLTLQALIPAAELVPILREKSADTASVVSRQALEILAGLPGLDAFEALMQVRSNLATESVAIWISALARRDEPIPAEIILELLEAPAAATRAAAAHMVAKHPETISVPLRLQLLNDSNSQVRGRGIQALRDAKGDLRAREAVIDRLNDASSLVRRSALEWLQGAAVDLQTFEARMEDPDPTVRIAAIRVAGSSHSTGASQKIIDRLCDPDLIVAQAASDQLAANDAGAPEDMLIDLLGDARDQVVRLSARSLGLLKSTSAIEHLQALAEHRSESVRVAAYEALGLIGQSHVAPWLFQRVADESGYPRAAINEAIGRQHHAKALDHLMADCSYTGPNPRPGPYPAPATAVATAAVRAVGELGDARAVPTLLQVYNDVLRNEPFWTSVASSLGKLGDARAKPALIEMGIVGQIAQGAIIMRLPPSTRIAALRALVSLRIMDLPEAILSIEPAHCVLEVRQAAAEILTTLTGRNYTYRLPAAQDDFFIEDREIAPDLSEFKLPICYLVNGPGSVLRSVVK
jgi:HEAT repeat protein